MRVQREHLIAYRSSVVTPDTAEALRMLEQSAAKLGNIRISYKGTPPSEATWKGKPGPTDYPPHLSMRATGREVYLRAILTDYDGPEEGRRQAEVAVLWGLAVPLRFTPWTRHCVPGRGDDVFHYLGPWQSLYDGLCSEGRGELAWPSLCAAAQTDVGTWGGNRMIERFVQAQLHRIGIPSGAVDGDIGDRTTSALRALGIRGSTLEETAGALARFHDPPRSEMERRLGHVLLPGEDVSVVSYGLIAASKTRQGVALTVDGPGRIIINVGEES